MRSRTEDPTDVVFASAAVGIVEPMLTFAGGTQDKLMADSRRRIGEGTSATLELWNADVQDVPRSLMGKGVDSSTFSFSLPLKAPNNRRETDGGTEPISTSNLGLASSAGSASIGAATTSTGPSDDGATVSLSVAGGHLGASAVFATTLM